MTPSCPQIFLNKWIEPKQWNICKLAINTGKLETWTGYFTETNYNHSNYSFHYNQSYFIQVCVPFHLLQLYVLFTVAFMQKLLKLNKPIWSRPFSPKYLQAPQLWKITKKKKEEWEMMGFQLLNPCLSTYQPQLALSHSARNATYTRSLSWAPLVGVL